MLDSIPVALLVGTALGVLSGLGIGGGSLLILWLTMALNVGAVTARGINLLFFLPSAAVACILRWKQGAVKGKTVLPAMIAGSAAAALLSWVGLQIDTSLLKKLFGGLLILTGLREVFYRPKSSVS